MDVSDFNDALKELGLCLSKKLNDTQQDHWYREIGEYPEVAITACFKILKNTRRKMPTIQEFNQLYYSWKQDNPRHFMRSEYQDECRECGGKGYLEAWVRGKEIKGFVADGQKVEAWYGTLLPCARCRNWKNVFPTQGNAAPKRRWTKVQAEEAGIMLRDPNQIQPGHCDKHFDSVAEAGMAATRRML